MQQWWVAFLLWIFTLFEVAPSVPLRVMNNQQQVVGQACEQLPTAQSSLANGPLTVGIWNVHKFQDKGWQDELAQLQQHSELLMLQELADQPLFEQGALGRWHWQQAAAFHSGATTYGVANAALKPLASCGIWSNEPLYGLPKTALLSMVKWHGQQVLIVNMHGVNFTWSLAPYRAQFAAVGRWIAQHSGPVIVAGDMNTWRQGRLAVMRRQFTGLGLHEVTLQPDHRSQRFGHALDHLWVRGLQVKQAYSPSQSVSDHRPIIAELTLAETGTR